MRLLIFLDELYFKNGNETYCSAYSAGRFLMNLREMHELIFSFPTSLSFENRKRTNTNIPEDTQVIPLPDWSTLKDYAMNYRRLNRAVSTMLLDIIKSVDAVWIRLPSLAGIKVAEIALKANIPVILHMAGDIRYAYANDKYKGYNRFIAFIAGHLIHYRIRQLVINHLNIAYPLCTGVVLERAFQTPSTRFFLDSEIEVNRPRRNTSAAQSFLFIGRLLKSKGISLLLETWREMEKDITLHIVGYGDQEDEVKRYASMDNRIIYHGFKGGQDLESLLLQCDCLIMPTINYPEGFPRVISEAWAFGLAVISTDVGGIRSIGMDHENLLFVRPGNKNDLLMAIAEIIHNDSLFKKLCDNGYNAGQALSRRNMLNVVESVLDSIALQERQEYAIQ